MLQFNGAIVDLNVMELEDASKYMIIAVNSNFGIYSFSNFEIYSL